MKKSQKIKIIFIISTVVLVALFLVFFILSINLKDALGEKYTIVSFLTYVFSLLGIISAGLGLKLVDKFKEKEEQEANLTVFVDESNKDYKGETQDN